MIWTGDDWWTLAIAILVAVCCALPGCFLVLRRMGMMADAISHTVLPGIAVAFILSGTRNPFYMLIGAAVFGLLTTLLTQIVERYGRMAVSSAMGVIFTTLFALGLVLVRFADNAELDPDYVLFGNLELAVWDSIDWIGYTIPRAIPILVTVFCINVAAILLFYKELKAVCFDPHFARATGIPVQKIHYLLMTLVAITTVAAFELVGSIMVVALIVIPAASAWLWCKQVWTMLLMASLLSVVSASLGMWTSITIPPLLSFGDHQFSDTSMASMIAVASGLCFIICHITAPESGLIAKTWRKRRQRIRRDCEDVLGVLYRLKELPETDRPQANLSFLHDVIGINRLKLLSALRYGNRRGEIQTAADRYLLTEQGEQRARRLVRAHRLWEFYLQEHFGLASDHLHEPAHRLEHLDDVQLEEALREELGHPAAGPHGRPLP